MTLNIKLEADMVMRYVGEGYGLTKAEILGRRRSQNIAEARAVAYFLVRKYGLSLPAIGRIFGRDHSTILSGIRSVARKMRTRPEIANLVLGYQTHVLKELATPCAEGMQELCSGGDCDSVNTYLLTPVDCYRVKSTVEAAE